MFMKTATKAGKTARLAVRVQPELYDSIAEAAQKSGWEVSDQVRFELMQLRGMWKGPHLPNADKRKAS